MRRIVFEMIEELYVSGQSLVIHIDSSVNRIVSLFGTGCMAWQRRKKSLMIFSSPTLYDPSIEFVCFVFSLDLIEK